MAGADAVALSIVCPTDDRLVAEELRQLRAELPESVDLLVGGAGADAYADLLVEIGAQHLNTIGALREWLRNRGTPIKGDVANQVTS